MHSYAERNKDWDFCTGNSLVKSPVWNDESSASFDVTLRYIAKRCKKKLNMTVKRNSTRGPAVEHSLGFQFLGINSPSLRHFLNIELCCLSTMTRRWPRLPVTRFVFIWKCEPCKGVQFRKQTEYLHRLFPAIRVRSLLSLIKK